MQKQEGFHANTDSLVKIYSVFCFSTTAAIVLAKINAPKQPFFYDVFFDCF